MRPDVLIKYGFLPEAFSTLWTNVRLLSCMNPDMLVEYRLLTERLATATEKKDFLTNDSIRFDIVKFSSCLKNTFSQ